MKAPPHIEADFSLHRGNDTYPFLRITRCRSFVTRPGLPRATTTDLLVLAPLGFRRETDLRFRRGTGPCLACLTNSPCLLSTRPCRCRAEGGHAGVTVFRRRCSLCGGNIRADSTTW